MTMTAGRFTPVWSPFAYRAAAKVRTESPENGVCESCHRYSVRVYVHTPGQASPDFKVCLDCLQDLIP